MPTTGAVPAPGALRPLARALLAAAAELHTRRRQAGGLPEPYPGEQSRRPDLPTQRDRASMDCPASTQGA
ncbi:MAG TPA: hypothetical protein VNG13_00595 [Mycobacteriales bacterium]|nr:hypothetical protein [Mycobacteriales bacterium]